MSGKFRRMIIIMLISISMILLVSCGTMEVSTNVKVNKDGSSNTVFRLVYDESIKSGRRWIVTAGIRYRDGN